MYMYFLCKIGYSIFRFLCKIGYCFSETCSRPPYDLWNPTTPQPKIWGSRPSQPPRIDAYAYTFHHSLLSACLTIWILTRCLSILFWLSVCESAGSRDYAFVGTVKI